MKTKIILLSFILFYSCSSTVHVYNSKKPYSLAKDINSEIISEFYKKDTNGISKKIYLLDQKNNHTPHN
jgi:hypothetical protein